MVMLVYMLLNYSRLDLTFNIKKNYIKNTIKIKKYMAVIKNHKNHSTIQIKKDIHFVFGSLDSDGSPVEKIKSAINEFKKYHETIDEEAPEVVMAWRSADEGDWVVSDDFRVIQILKKTENKTKNAYNTAIIRTCVGTFAVNPKTFFDTDFELHPDRYRVSNTGKEAIERISERDEMTNNERIFAERVAKGEDAKKAYMKTFTTNNERYASDMSKVLLRQERIQKNISSEIESLLKEEGVSKRYIIRQYKQLVDDGMADLRYCSGSVVRALDSLVDISGMKPDKTTSSQSMGVLQEVEDDRLSQIEEAENFVLEDKKDDEFEQEYLESPKESSIEPEFKKVGDNLLTKAGMDLLS
jgi:hypothetical protein